MKRFAFTLALAACASSPSPPVPPPSASAAPVAAPEPVEAGAGVPEASAPAAPLTYPTAPDDTDAIILRREACNGQCPMYSVAVTSNGNVHFYGEQFTTTAGYAFGKVDPGTLAALYKFMDAHPVSAALKTSARRPDHPTEYVVSHRRGAVKKMDPPGEIADEMDRALGSAQWVGDARPMNANTPPLSQPAFEAMLGKQLRALDKCASMQTEITLALHVTPEGKARSESASGKKEADSTCIDKVVGAWLFPIADANVAPLTLTIGNRVIPHLQ